ncbi:MAG TPA: hypothetical protein VF857_08800 [Spirochaetota bacterium]
MRKIVMMALLFVLCAVPRVLYPQSGESLGKVAQINRVANEVVISSPRAAEKFVMGDRVIITVGSERILMRVSFPMMTLAKCVVEPSSVDKIMLIKVGLPVYRFRDNQKRIVKYYGSFDYDYLIKEKKVRFINEILKSELGKCDYYFDVTYDDQGLIVRTVEVKNQKKNVADYYKDDRIIKKEWFSEQSGQIRRIQVYDYYPNGILKESGDYDVEKNQNKIDRYDQKGDYINENSDQAASDIPAK